MRDSMGEVPTGKLSPREDDAVIHVDTLELVSRLAEVTRLKLDGEVKDPGKVPEYRRPRPLVPELDAVTGQETVTLRPEFFDDEMTYEDRVRSYCERRKETYYEKCRHHPNMVRAKADEQTQSLSTLQGKGKTPQAVPEVAPRVEDVPRSPYRPVVLDGSFADTDSDF